MSRRLAHAYHSLSQLLNAGIPVLRAMNTAAARPGTIGKALRRMSDDVRSGSTMADAMRQHPRVFADFDVGVIAVGEESGALPERFAQLAQWYDFVCRMKGIMIAGLAYPLFILHVGALLAPMPALVLGGGGILAYIRSVIGILALVYIPAVAVFAFLKFRPRHGRLRLLTDSFFLGIPVVGGALEQLALSRFTQAFHIGSQAGVPYVRCMEMALLCTENEALAARLAGGLESARHGEDVSAGFSNRLPVYYRQMWEVGEETGDLDEVTGRLAKMTAESAETRFTELARWLPRIVYFVIMGIMVYQIFKGYSQIARTW